MLDVNSTFLSKDQDKDCSKYRTGFELYPYNETSEFALFMGQLTGEYQNKGERHDQFCSVRTMTNSHPCFRDWDMFLERSRQARFLAEQFNKLVVQKRALTFCVPIRAEMDTVWNRKSLLGRLLLLWKPHRKSLKEEEFVVLEDYLGKSINTYINDWGLVGSQESDILQAFGHFTWSFTNGRLIICGLKGQRMVNGQFRLTDPTLHSDQQAMDSTGRALNPFDNFKNFGSSDKGRPGIVSFFKYHRCNHMCQGLPLPL